MRIGLCSSGDTTADTAVVCFVGNVPIRSSLSCHLATLLARYAPVPRPIAVLQSATARIYTNGVNDRLVCRVKCPFVAHGIDVWQINGFLLRVVSSQRSSVFVEAASPRCELVNELRPLDLPEVRSLLTAFRI